MKKATILLPLLLAALATYAQQPEPTAAGLKKSFAQVGSGIDGESDAFDALVTKTARQLVTYLKAHDLTAAQARQMGLGYAAASDGSLRVYTYSYQSGGTRGTIHRSVLGWRNAAGQRFAYATDEEGYFSTVYRLASPGRTQYLLLGGDKGDSRCYGNEAWVVELKGNYLVLTNGGFGKEPLLLLCNTEMTFDARRQLLRLDLSQYQAIIDDEMRLQKCGYHRRPGAKSLSLQFSGGRFVQGK